MPSIVLDTDAPRIELDLNRVLEVDEALRKLESVDPRQCRLVECRYFGGLSLEETAAVLGVSLATAKWPSVATAHPARSFWHRQPKGSLSQPNRP
jgi:DNA-directed RNA polymerase specialized sigma24 family protein